MDSESNLTTMEIVHTAESSIRRPILMCREMFGDLIRSRHLAWRFFVRNLKADYRQSVLGYLWLIIPPLAMTAIWVFLHRQGILSVGKTDASYPVFVVTGLLLWNCFVGALISPQATVNGAATMLTKVYFPREALLLASILQTLFDTAIRMVLLVGVLAWFQSTTANTMLLAPFGVLMIVALGFAIGTFLIPLGLLYQDIGRGLSIATQIWFFATPIVYPAPTEGLGTLVMQANPVSPLLVTTRQMVISGNFTHTNLFFIVALITLALLFISWVFYRISMPHLIARMGA